MRVAFDTSATLFDPGGTSRYIEAMLQRRDLVEGLELVEVSMGTSWPWTVGLPRQARILVHDLAWIPRGAAAAASAVGADVLHGPAFRVPARAPMATSVSIHDDTPWDDPPTASWWTRRSLRRSLRAAAPGLGVALVGSEHAAARARAVLPALAPRVRVTLYGIDHDKFRPQAPEAVRASLARLGINTPYVLMVAPYGSRKNYAAMCAALETAGPAPAGPTLVTVGRTAAGGDPGSLAVRHLGRVGDEDLATLYAGAEYLFFASLKEGFGFPLLEAMACGCPVLASRGTVLEELAGDAALLADPLDPAALAAAAAQLLADAELRARLREAGARRAAEFTWEATLLASAAAWREIAGF